MTDKWQLIRTAPIKSKVLILIFQRARGPWRKRIKEIYASNLSGKRAWGDDYPTHWQYTLKPPKSYNQEK